MNKYRYKILVCVFVFLSILFLFSASSSLSLSTSDIDSITLARINEIRKTGNTDVSGVTGTIYYVSSSGSDDNNGTTTSTPFKTVAKVNTLLSNKTIKNGDAVLFKRGDTFRGAGIIPKDNNIIFGSYGDTTKAKPKIYGSENNAKTTGTWVKVSGNIWKYQVNNADKKFPYDVGEIWFFCNSGNNECDRTTTDGKTKYKFSSKVTSYSNVTESESMLGKYLYSDLQFYHMGHAYDGTTTNNGVLYLYSKTNPAERFDDIEISLGKNGITIGSYTDIVVDNIEFSFFGRHGVAINDVANATITNCELSYIGGMVQKYDKDAYWPIRFGNAIQSYGAIKDKTGFPVKNGFVANNNYIYEVYDAGLTFQYNAAEGRSNKVERVEYDNNVVEYCSYNIEYWNGTKETTDTAKMNESYLGNIYFTNNILRFAGIGLTETRGEHGYEALIKSWWNSGDTVNIIKPGGEFLIENNIFDTTGVLKDNTGTNVGVDMLHLQASSEQSLPTVKNNKFYNYKGRYLGWLDTNDSYRAHIPYNEQLSFNDGYFKDNEFYVYDAETPKTNTVSGTSGNVSWSLNLKTHVFTLSGSGAMADYTESSLAPWTNYKDYIKDIVIGENVTYLGKYAFYGSEYVQNIYLNAKNLTDMVSNNNTFTLVGKKSSGVTVIIGANVTKIPNYFINPGNSLNVSGYVRHIKFLGNKVTSIGNYAFGQNYIEEALLPDSVETIGKAAFVRNPSLKIVHIPSKVTEIKTQTFYRCDNLEIVILGKNVATLAANSFAFDPRLERIVITNDNFNYDISIDSFGLMDTTTTNPLTFSKIQGLQIFGPSSLQDVVTGLKSIGINAFYIKSVYYRPLVRGDNKQFYALFDEVHYGENTTYEAKALANADVIVTGAKYRYMNRYGQVIYIDGVDIDLSTNTITNMFMDVELQGKLTNVENKVLPEQTVLYYGNSYSTGFGTHGMASTTIEDDYIYRINQYLKSMNSNINYARYAINPWEEYRRSNGTVDGVTQYIKTDRTEETEKAITTFNGKISSPNDVGIVFIQMSENLANDIPTRMENFEADFTYMINRFKESYPNATIYVLYNKYSNSQVTGPIKTVCNNLNIQTMNYGNKWSNDSRFISYIGAKYWNFANKISYAPNDGYACHPGDYGFVTIADSILDQLKTIIVTQSGNPEVTTKTTIKSTTTTKTTATNTKPTITSSKYTISSNKVKAKPTKNEFLKSELSSNITVSTSYDVYNNGVKLSNTSKLATGSVLKANGYEYKIIVLGDTTGDGNITLGDISQMYNHYKKKTTLTGDNLEAGLITGNTSITLGDVSKVYNFYKGKTTL